MRERGETAPPPQTLEGQPTSFAGREPPRPSHPIDQIFTTRFECNHLRKVSSKNRPLLAIPSKISHKKGKIKVRKKREDLHNASSKTRIEDDRDRDVYSNVQEIHLGRNQDLVELCPLKTGQVGETWIWRLPGLGTASCVPRRAILCRYQSNPGEAHWCAAKNILKYLRRIKDDFLVYGGDDKLIVQGYTDASFQTDRDGFESQSGYVFILNGGVVSWKSSKQDTVADSTTEAEYIAASEAAKEAVWMRKFIDELGVVPSISGPIDIYCDNNGAIAQAKEPSSSSKSRHVMRKYHLIRRIVIEGDIKMCKVHTDDNIADPLTKPMPRPKHDSHTKAKGLKHIGEWL